MCFRIFQALVITFLIQFKHTNKILKIEREFLRLFGDKETLKIKGPGSLWNNNCLILNPPLHNKRLLGLGPRTDQKSKPSWFRKWFHKGNLLPKKEMINNRKILFGLKWARRIVGSLSRNPLRSKSGQNGSETLRPKD